MPHSSSRPTNGPGADTPITSIPSVGEGPQLGAEQQGQADVGGREVDQAPAGQVGHAPAPDPGAPVTSR